MSLYVSVYRSSCFLYCCLLFVALSGCNYIAYCPKQSVSWRQHFKFGVSLSWTAQIRISHSVPYLVHSVITLYYVCRQQKPCRMNCLVICVPCNFDGDVLYLWAQMNLLVKLKRFSYWRLAHTWCFPSSRQCIFWHWETWKDTFSSVLRLTKSGVSSLLVDET